MLLLDLLSRLLRWPRTLVVASLLLVGLGSARVASGTVMRKMDLPELSNTAELVVLGKVEAQTATWDPTGRRIVTRVDLRVERALKGGHAPGSVVQFERLGGVVDGIGQKVFGEPAFSTGETTLLFLRRLDLAPGRPMRVLGMAQGKLAVFLGSDGVRRIGRDTGGLHLFQRAPSGEKLTVQPGTLPRTLDDVIVEIQSALRSSR